MAEQGKERARHWQYADLPGVDLLRPATSTRPSYGTPTSTS
ncbi:hypothetical protein ACR6C2_33705 [Streptomyces sp. INA 01156]